MADKLERVLLDYVLTPNFQKTKAGLKTLVIDQEQIAKALASTSKQALTTDRALEGVNRELVTIARERAIGNLAKNFTALEQETVSTRIALAELTDQLVLLGASDAEIKQVTRSIVEMGEAAERVKVVTPGRGGNALGQTERGITSLAGLSGGLGGGAATEGLRLAGDLTGTLDALPALKSGLQELGEQLLTTGPITTKLAGSIAEIDNPATQAAAKGALVAGSLGAMAVAGIAMAVAFDRAQKIVEDSARGTQAFVAAQETYYTAVVTKGTVAVQAQIKQLSDEREVARLRLTESQKFLEQARSNIDNAGLVTNVLGNAAIALGANLGGIQDLEVLIGELQKEVQTSDIAITRLNQGLEQNAFVAGDAAIAAEKAKEAEEALTKSREDAVGNIVQLTNQRGEVINRAIQQDTQIQEDRLLRESRAAEDLDALLEGQETAHQDRLTAIADAGQKRLEQIKEAGNSKLAQADEQLSKLQQNLGAVTTKLNADRAKIDSEFMRSEIEAFNKFKQQETKATAAYNKEKIRTLEDLNDSLLDAEEQNSVVAFIAAKRAGQKELKRLSEDASDAEKERQEQFDEERRLAEQRRQERIADLEAAAQERRNDIQAQINERKAAREELVKEIDAQLEAEKTRIKATLDAQQKAFDDQQERDEAARKLRNDRQEEDEAIADRRRRDAHSKELVAIDAKLTKELNAASLVGNAWVNAGNRAIASANQIASSGLTPYTGSGGGGGVAFAEGGIVTRPTVAMLGERPGSHELLMSFRPSEGIDAALSRHGLGGGRSVVFGDIHLGDIGNLNRGEVEGMLRSGLHELAGAVIEILDKAG